MNRKPCNKNGSHKAAVVINGAGDGTRDFLRKSHPSAQAPSGVLLKTCHWHVFLTQNHLSVLVPIKVRFQNCRQRCGCRKVINGAGDGTRTRECELGKLVPYHLATPAYIRFALHAKPCGHYSLKHAPASEQNENVRESSADASSSTRERRTLAVPFSILFSRGRPMPTIAANLVFVIRSSFRKALTFRPSVSASDGASNVASVSGSLCWRVCFMG